MMSKSTLYFHINKNAKVNFKYFTKKQYDIKNHIAFLINYVIYGKPTFVYVFL